MDDTTQSVLLAAGIFALGVAAVWIDRHLHPKSTCQTCKGTGRLRSSLSQRWKDCPNCDGGVRDRRTK